MLGASTFGRGWNERGGMMLEGSATTNERSASAVGDGAGLADGPLR